MTSEAETFALYLGAWSGLSQWRNRPRQFVRMADDAFAGRGGLVAKPKP